MERPSAAPSLIVPPYGGREPVEEAWFVTCPFNRGLARTSLRQLRHAAGHNEGFYAIVAGTTSPKPCALISLIGEGKVPYVGSSMHLTHRVRTAINAVDTKRLKLTDHGFGRTWRDVCAATMDRDGLSLIMIGYKCGYSMEHLVLREAKAKAGRWPLGNKRWPIPPPTSPRRSLLPLDWTIMEVAQHVAPASSR